MPCCKEPDIIRACRKRDWALAERIIRDALQPAPSPQRESEALQQVIDDIEENNFDAKIEDLEDHKRHILETVINARSDWQETPLMYIAKAASHPKDFCSQQRKQQQQQQEEGNLDEEDEAKNNSNTLIQIVHARDAPSQFLPSSSWFLQAPLCSLLLDNGANINSRNQFGDTALHLAAGSGNYSMVQFLCAQPNINFRIENKSFDTPLAAACKHQAKLHRDRAKLEQQRREDDARQQPHDAILIKRKDDDEQFWREVYLTEQTLAFLEMVERPAAILQHTSEFVIAACKRHEWNAVKTAVLHVPSLVDAVNDACHSTVLHYAAEASVGWLVQFLLEHGAWADPVDNEGRRPLDLATDFQIQRMLRKSSAQLI